MKLVRLAVLCMVVHGVVTAAARGQSPQWIVGPDQGVPGVNGVVFATTVWDPDGEGPEEPLLIVGGQFTLAGTTASTHVAAWDGTAWRAFASQGPVNEVHAMTVHNGDLYVGDSSRVWRWTGSTWVSIGQCSGSIEAMTSHAGSLVIAGFVSVVNSVTVNDIARWDGTTWQGFGTGMSNSGLIFGVGVYNGDLIATGNFTTAGGVNASRIARWDGSAWSALGSGLNGNGHELIEYNGALVVGGTFSTAGGVSARRVARWNGASWSAFGTGVGSASSSETVRGLAVIGNDLIASGQFGASTSDLFNVARWNGSTWTPMTLGTPLSTTTFVHALRAFRGELIAGGANINTPSSGGVLGVARWNGEAWTSLGTGLNGTPNVFTPYQGRLVIGGSFQRIGAVRSTGLASWDGSSWTAFESGIGLAPAGAPTARYGSVHSFLVNGDDLIVGGSFEYAGGFVANNIAAWDGASWRPLGEGLAPIGRIVLSMVAHEGEVIAGGSFTNAGATVVNRIARWDGSAWNPLADGFNGSVRAVASFGGHLYAGGTFTESGTTPLVYVARWDGASWQAVGAGLAGGAVDALIVHEGSLYAGGAFTHAGAIRVNGLARWDGSAWQALPSILPFGASVTNLGANEEGLYASGSFIDPRYQRIARWDGAAWQSVGNPSTAGAIGFYGPEVVIGSVGVLSTIDGHRVSYLLGRWTESGAPWIAQGPESIRVAAGDDAVLSVTPATGYENLTFAWLRDGVTVIDGPAPGGGVIAGAASPTLMLSGIQGGDAGAYVCSVSNSCGEAMSEAATLSLACAGDFNHDGVLSSQDFFDFVAAFFDLALAADFNRDGFVNSQDFFDFVAALFAGC